MTESEELVQRADALTERIDAAKINTADITQSHWLSRVAVTLSALMVILGVVLVVMVKNATHDSAAKSKTVDLLVSDVEALRAQLQSTGQVPVVPAPTPDIIAQRGDPGAAGPQGDPGVGGSKGDTGVQGDTGLTGGPGETGAVGQQGSPGPAGPQGDPGAIGSNGADGAPGPVGASGADGASGPAGPQGDPGASGPAGLQGDPGPAGADGQPGPQGPAGPPGTAEGTVETITIAGITFQCTVTNGVCDFQPQGAP